MFRQYLLDIKTLQKFDKNRMYKIYDDWPQISRDQYESDLEPIDFDNISHIVFAGMGGSGAISDIFSSILSKTNIHVEVIKGYILPKTVDSDSLVVTTSISGNTEETLSVLNSATKLESKIIAFSNGGKMEKFCHEKNINYRNISMKHSPRASFTTFLFSMLKILESVIPIKKVDVIESLDKLEILKKEISSNNLTENNPSLLLANWISDIPLIYYPWGLQSAAIRFKNSLQENAKIHAITEDVIEACHNGIVSWEKPSTVQPILIQGEEDYIKTKERWRILKEFFKENEIEFYEIKSIQGNILSKLINLIYLLDYTTIYRAVISEIDPTPVTAIDYVKERL
jgi:glucose/mannose-6-phosphate isomerase